MADNKRPSKTTDTTIVLCEHCKGEGTNLQEELTDYHKREYRTWLEICNWCNGEGRVSQTIVVTRSFVNSNQQSTALLFRNADDKDWEHLFKMIPNSGHGKFWKAVMLEVQAALKKHHDI